MDPHTAPPQTVPLETSRITQGEQQRDQANQTPASSTHEASASASPGGPAQGTSSTTTPDDSAASSSADVQLTRAEMEDLQKRIVAALMTCFDPEVPVNIYELGLIYNVEIATNGTVNLRMTLTSPACPVAGSLPGDVQRKVQALEGVRSAKVDLVWDPPWDKNRMSEAAKLQLGIED